MKNVISTLIIFLTISVATYAQQLSKHIQIPTSIAETGLQLLEDGPDNYIIPCGSIIVNEDNYYEEIIGFLNIDKSGNPIWSKTIVGEPGENLKLTVEAAFIRDEFIYACTRVEKGSYYIIRLWILDKAANIIKIKEYDIFDQNLIHIDGIIEGETHLMVYGRSNTLSLSYSYILKVDLSLDSYELMKYSENNLQKRSIDLEIYGEGYILGFAERTASGENGIALLELDSNFNILSEKKMLSSTYSLHRFKLLKNENEGVYMIWGKDNRIGPPDSFPYPDAIYRLDKDLNIIWEYVLSDITEKLFFDATLTTDGSIFGSGTTDHFYRNHDRLTEGFCFLVDSSGNLKWERFIADYREPRGGRFWSGIETDEGFALIGDIDALNPTGVPFLNDPGVWYLTLDKNGCWNGNCNRDIAITGETSSISPTSTKHSNITDDKFNVFPNPSSGILIIEEEERSIQPKKIQVYDYTGKLVFEYELQAPKSTINLSHLPTGNYLGKISHDDGKIETKKIIIQR